MENERLVNSLTALMVIGGTAIAPSAAKAENSSERADLSPVSISQIYAPETNETREQESHSLPLYMVKLPEVSSSDISNPEVLREISNADLTDLIMPVWENMKQDYEEGLSDKNYTDLHTLIALTENQDGVYATAYLAHLKETENEGEYIYEEVYLLALTGSEQDGLGIVALEIAPGEVFEIDKLTGPDGISRLAPSVDDGDQTYTLDENGIFTAIGPDISVDETSLLYFNPLGELIKDGEVSVAETGDDGIRFVFREPGYVFSPTDQFRLIESSDNDVIEATDSNGKVRVIHTDNLLIKNPQTGEFEETQLGATDQGYTETGLARFKITGYYLGTEELTLSLEVSDGTMVNVNFFAILLLTKDVNGDTKIIRAMKPASFNQEAITFDNGGAWQTIYSNSWITENLTPGQMISFGSTNMNADDPRIVNYGPEIQAYVRYFDISDENMFNVLQGGTSLDQFIFEDITTICPLNGLYLSQN